MTNHNTDVYCRKCKRYMHSHWATNVLDVDRSHEEECDNICEDCIDIIEPENKKSSYRPSPNTRFRPTPDERFAFLTTHWNSIIDGMPLHRWIGVNCLRLGGTDIAVDAAMAAFQKHADAISEGFQKAALLTTSVHPTDIPPNVTVKCVTANSIGGTYPPVKWERNNDGSWTAVVKAWPHHEPIRLGNEYERLQQALDTIIEADTGDHANPVAYHKAMQAAIRKLKKLRRKL